VCVTGSGGFIGGHLARRLKQEGCYVIGCDWKEQEYIAVTEFCDEFHLVDLRQLTNCLLVTNGCEEVYNLAADMGGMGFIQSNHAALFYNNTMITFNVTEACRKNKVRRLFYSSSACVYPEHAQEQTEMSDGLREATAWPAAPQDAYGLEKIVGEQLGLHYAKEFNMFFCSARFHNVYGPQGTWKGGREKAPAAFLRKAAASTKGFEVWGDGKQTRSFTYIDDCVEGILRLMRSTCGDPINLGSTEMVSMNQLAEICCQVAGKSLPIVNLTGPEGVRGRNSNNEFILKHLGWEPKIPLAEGLAKTYVWIKEQVDTDAAKGIDIAQYSQSHVVPPRNPDDVADS